MGKSKSGSMKIINTAKNLTDKDIIDFIQIRGCRLIHGSMSWLATLTANIFTLGKSDTLEHQWLYIHTKTDRHFCFQANGNLYLTEHKNSYDANLEGKSANKISKNRDTIWRSKYYPKNISMKLLTDSFNYEKKYPYKLCGKNCQYYAERLYEHIERMSDNQACICELTTKSGNLISGYIRFIKGMSLILGGKSK